MIIQFWDESFKKKKLTISSAALQDVAGIHAIWNELCLGTNAKYFTNSAWIKWSVLASMNSWNASSYSMDCFAIDTGIYNN